MFEFNNRVDLQRSVIKLINSGKFEFELAGLSKSSIERWNIENPNVNPDIISLLFKISEQMFFLANKSQESITNEYQLLNSGTGILMEKLKHLIDAS